MKKSDGGDVILRQAYAAVAERVELTSDPGAAYEQATALAKAADDIVGDAALLRARMARRLLRAEGMSLAQLASRIGVSKSRADQLMRTATRGEKT